MRVHLMHPDREFTPPTEAHLREPWVQALVQDLELDPLIALMSREDPRHGAVARAALLAPPLDPGTIRYRQAVLDDCLHAPSIARELFTLANRTLAAERGLHRPLFLDTPQSVLDRALGQLDLFLNALAEFRSLAERNLPLVHSAGLTRLFTAAAAELADDYLNAARAHLGRLTFREGLLMSARLGDGNQGVGYVVRAPNREHVTLLHRAPVASPDFSFTLPDRDEAGYRALSELRDRGLRVIADALDGAARDVLGFFGQLRTQLGFYLAGVALHQQLVTTGAEICLPDPEPVGAGTLVARGLYDPVLQLHARAVANDLDTRGAALLLVTGANQGGKTTLLRAIGVAQLMMQAGLFVAAESFTSGVAPVVVTHYQREEDARMTHGKFDEELARMSELVPHLRPGALVLSNESFAATNEREGSAIGDAVVRGLLDAGVRVCLVTHLYDLAQRLYASTPSVSLRPERSNDGGRTFRLVEQAPEPTSYGADLYARVFGEALVSEGAR